MEAGDLLERLRDFRPDGPLARLADVATSEWLDQELVSWLEPRATARRLRTFLQAWLGSDEVEGRLEELARDVADELRGRDTRLGGWLGPDGTLLLEALAERSFTPSKDLVLALLDREPMRQLLRRLLIDALIGFGARLRAPVADNRLTRGLGDLGRFARAQAMSRAGALGTLATEVVGAVSGEVERQLEKRAAEFADSILSDTLQKLAGLLSDPELADEQAELRLALLEGILELPSLRLADEIEGTDVRAVTGIVRERLGVWLEGPDAEETLASSIEWLLGRDAERTVGTVLDELGLREPVVALVREVVLEGMQVLVSGDRFGLWLSDLLAPSTGTKPGGD